jgi:hypothetical protein
MIVAGRLPEIVTGTSYHDLLKRELFATREVRASGEPFFRQPHPALGLEALCS